MEIKYQIVRGMKDIVNSDAEKFNFITETAIELAKKFNFTNSRTSKSF